MSGYSRQENRVNQTSNYKAYNRKGERITLDPGKPIGVIAVQSKDHEPGRFNPLVLYFSVNKYRKDLNAVIDQTNKKAQLPKYERSLFDSCFKNW